VYEIGHNFRNEGFSRQHSPEYTMLEAYQAYADYTDMMELCETMIEGAARELLGTTRLTVAGREVDLAAPWPRVPLLDAITEYSGVDVRAHPSQGELSAAAACAGVELPSAAPRAKIIDELLKTFVEPRLIAPTHLIDYPVELSPLAKRKPGTDDLVERFESFIGGVEIANAFTELNDPIDQRARFAQQQDDRAHGDEEAHPIDEDFLLALEHGMPPAGGIGLGVDRVTMVFTGATNIRDVILFPHLRRDER
ncbi:MAG TPA: amino acid--tRNA ligase-related protein, partial [Chloroflexota bacterium]|nr:amino acid--tRNA ligase-related protein [Chloroflexota bacterium]